MEGSLTLHCDNCGDEVALEQEYDQDYSEYGGWQLVHASTGHTWCPTPVATTN
jgi:hypothetical protein